MASKYLEDNDCEILETDDNTIIMSEDDTLVVIDIKVRGEGIQGLPEDVVTKELRAQQENKAIRYLVDHPRGSGRVRFDVIAIQMVGEAQCLLRHHRDAFSTEPFVEDEEADDVPVA